MVPALASALSYTLLALPLIVEEDRFRTAVDMLAVVELSLERDIDSKGEWLVDPNHLGNGTIVVITNSGETIGWFRLDTVRHISTSGKVAIARSHRYAVALNPVAQLSRILVALRHQTAYCAARSRTRGVFELDGTPIRDRWQMVRAGTVGDWFREMKQKHTVDFDVVDLNQVSLAFALRLVQEYGSYTTYRRTRLALCEWFLCYAAASYVRGLTTDYAKELLAVGIKRYRVSKDAQFFTFPFETVLSAIYVRTVAMETIPLRYSVNDHCLRRHQHETGQPCMQLVRGNAIVCRGLVPRLLRSRFIQNIIDSIDRNIGVADCILRHRAAHGMLSSTRLNHAELKQAMVRFGRQTSVPIGVAPGVAATIAEHWDILFDAAVYQNEDVDRQTLFANPRQLNLFNWLDGTGDKTRQMLPACIHKLVTYAIIEKKRHLRNNERLALGGFIARTVRDKADQRYMIYTALRQLYCRYGIPVPAKHLDSIMAVVVSRVGTRAITCTYYMRGNLCPYSTHPNRLDACCTSMHRVLPPDIEDCIGSPEWISTLPVRKDGAVAMDLQSDSTADGDVLSCV